VKKTHFKQCKHFVSQPSDFEENNNMYSFIVHQRTSLILVVYWESLFHQNKYVR